MKIFWGSVGIFERAKIQVFYGFQSSVSISTPIGERKKLAPSVRSLSKALFSELSGEPSTKGLPIFIQTLFEFFYGESATSARSKYRKMSKSKNSVHHFTKSKVHMPPPKIALKIVKPSAKKITMGQSNFKVYTFHAY